MGNNTPKDERLYKYQALHNGIYEIEKDILKDLDDKNYLGKKYNSYGLINKDICKKYPYLLKDKFDFNLTLNYNFNYNDLPHSNKVKNYKINNENFGFTFPSNFIFVNEDFMYVLRDHVNDPKIKNKLVSKFDTIIGGGCLIMKNPNDTQSKNPYRYIILYRDIKDEEGNEIDFFLRINDKTKRENVIKYILENGLWKFFEIIKYSYKDVYKNFGDGYIFRSCSKERIEKYLNKIKQKNSQPQIHLNNPQMIPQNKAINFNQNNFSDNFVNNPGINPMANISSIPQNNFSNKKMERYATSITKNKYAKNDSDLLLNAAILFLFSIDELKKYFFGYKNVDFQSFRTIIISKADQNIKVMKTYVEIFSELLTKIVPNNLMDKDYYYEQYNEEKIREKFFENHKKGNIIQKMFFIPKKEKILCNKCNMNTFKFDYSQFIILKNSQMNLLNQILFEKETETKQGNYCNFCNGQITTLTIERKCLSLPEWLIVIIEQTQINYLMINSFLLIPNGNNIAYTLYKFIEANTNFLYCIDLTNTQLCNKFDGKSLCGSEKLSDKKAAVLIYNLNKNVNNMVLQDNIQNNLNKNMNQMNNAQLKNNQNFNQQNIFPQQNINSPQNINMSINEDFNNNFAFNNMFVPGMNNINFPPLFNNMNNNMQPNLNMNMNNNFMMNNNLNWMNMQNQNNLMNNNMMMNNMFNNNINNCINDINLGMNNLNMNMNMMNNNMNLMNNMNMQGNLINNNKLVNFDNIIVIQFISTDFKINRGIKCLPSDKFVEVEDKLYQIYPEFKTTNNSFITEGRAIIRFQTIAENKIKDGQVVQLIREE